MICNSEEGPTPKNETKAVMVSRLLTPENQAHLLAWAKLAFAAENSVRKLYGLDSAKDGLYTLKTREYSRSDIL